ncbi:hypothetical protein H5410_049573 [Solanum commersonii]|uniref:Uncharacterized protein n=1 Tax=Solanum commersonii TaxID=4109 RepID=A0A9J5WTA5_SOLCO|nr:hypothetical protein H5410_049573 [Solanum commersonii]
MERTLTEVTTNVDEVQKRVLDEILNRNANVEYLQRLNLKGHTDRETFKKVVPVITYEDIQSDINRIANGDRSPILCSQPVSEFLTRMGEKIDTNNRGREREEITALRPYDSEAKTPGGLLARPVLTSIYKSRHFRSRDSPVSPYTNPIEAILCLNSNQSMYSQMLCGLCQNREVIRVGFVFASAFIRAI